MIKKTFTTLLAVFACALTSNAASIVWGALDFTKGVGFGDEAGVDLAPGSAVAVGVFRLTDAQVQQRGVDLSSSNSQTSQAALADLQANFIPFATGAIGDGVGGLPGLMSRTDSRDSSSLGTPAIDAAGKQLYLWASNGSNINSALQIGIFTIDKTMNANWQVPGELPIPGTTTIDLANMISSPTTFAPGASVIFGSGINGTNATLGGPNITTKTVGVVPEPSMLALLGVGMIGILQRRRR